VTFSGRVFHSRAQLPEKLDRQWLKDGCVGQQEMMSMQSGYADEPRQQMTDGVPQRSFLVYEFVYQNSQLKLDALRHLQPVQLCQQWRDAVVPRCKKHKPSSSVVVAEFNTVCIRLVRWDGMPDSVALP